jgi:hypothetical protein
MMNTHKLFTDNSNISVSHLLAEYLTLLTKAIKELYELRRLGEKREYAGKEKKKEEKV